MDDDVAMEMREAGEATRARRVSPMRATFASFAYRDFVYLWLGQVTHAFALWLEQAARPLLILALTGSAVQLGGVIVVRTVPGFVLGPLAGVVADNFNRRTVLMATKTIVLGLSALFAILMVTERVEVWHIYAFSFLRGATMAFDQPARRAMIPSVVPGHLVTNAMALSTGTMGAMRIAGGAAAGILMGYMGLAAPFVAIVFVYLAAVLFTWMLRTPDHTRSGYQGAWHMGVDLVDGLRFAWKTPAIRYVLIISLGYCTFGMAFMHVFAPLFATQVLGIGMAGYGYMLAVMGVGSLLGALGLAAANPRRGRGTLMLILLGLIGISLILFTASTYLDSIAIVFVMVIILGLGQSSFMPLMNAVSVEAAPDHMRGRVMGILSLDRAMTALGALPAGILAASHGTQVAQIYFGLACIITAIVMFIAYPALRRVN